MHDHQLSYPAGESINDYINSELCSVNYSTFDDALQVISAKGEGALMAKMNISNACRFLDLYVLKTFKKLFIRFENFRFILQT